MTKKQTTAARTARAAARGGVKYTIALKGTDPSDHPDRVFCQTCGWTLAMICPECPGCGCYNSRCSGWRHQEYMDEEERAELDACDECGGDTTSGYGCHCDDDQPSPLPLTHALLDDDDDYFDDYRDPDPEPPDGYYDPDDEGDPGPEAPDDGHDQ